jgi:hypothetical protein
MHKIVKKIKKIYFQLKQNLIRILVRRFFPVVLSYDNTHTVVYDKDEAINCYTDEYLLALASAGEINLAGMITSSSIAPYNQWVTAEDFERMVRQRNDLIDSARKSGFRNIPGHVRGTKGHLKRPISGRIEDTEPIGSEGSRLIVHEAKKASDKKPIVAVMCGPLTVIADAYLIEQSIVHRVIVVWFGGGINDMADYNGITDPWAAYIVLKKIKLVQFPAMLNAKGRFPYSPKVPKTKLYDLPKSPLREWMIAKEHHNGQPGNLDADAPPAISLMRADYAIRAKRVSFSNWMTYHNREVPAFENDPSGKTIVITEASQKVATKEWWRALKNPKAFSELG